MMDFNLPHFFYEEDSFATFLLVSIAMGGGAAWLSGRAIAGTWRPLWMVLPYMLVLASAVRFLHFALFEGSFASLHYYLVDFTLCLAIALIGFRAARAGQMASQYGWLYRRTGAFRWARRGDGMASDSE